MSGPVVEFLRSRQIRPLSWKCKVENDPQIKALVKEISKGPMLRVFCQLAGRLPLSREFLAETYVRSLAKTKTLSAEPTPAAARRYLRAYLNQFEDIPQTDLSLAQRFLTKMSLNNALYLQSSTVIAHCPACGLVALGSSHNPATIDCDCGSTIWKLESLHPLTPLSNLIRDDLFLELGLSVVVEKQMAALSYPVEVGSVSCSISYRSLPREVELDVVGYKGDLTCFFEARTSKITVNDVTQKRGQILELISDLAKSRGNDLGAMRVVFVSPVPHDNSIDTESYGQLCPLPAFFITGKSMDELPTNLERILNLTN